MFQLSMLVLSPSVAASNQAFVARTCLRRILDIILSIVPPLLYRVAEAIEATFDFSNLIAKRTWLAQD